MSARVYCFGSAKGGSGKTVITATIASFLTSVGKKCLIIDCDAATHGITLLYLVEVSAHLNESRMGLFDCVGVRESEEVIEKSTISIENGVDFLPATYRFSSSVDLDESTEYFLPNLERIMKRLRPKYDIILLDAQAGSDVHARMALGRQVSDEVIIVSEYDPLSSAGVDRLRHLLGDDLGYARTWILLNKMLPEFVDRFTEFLSVTKYLPPIPWNADVVRAYARRELALDLEEGNEFTLAIMRMVGVLFGEAIEAELRSWSKDRAYALKAPLEEQYENAERELMIALAAREKLRARERRMLFFRLYVVTLCIAVAILLGVNFDFLGFTDQSSSYLGNFLDLVYPAVALVVALGGVFWAVTRWFGRERTAESYRYGRIIESLQERLRKLEVLRAADYETIIKQKTKD